MKKLRTLLQVFLLAGALALCLTACGSGSSSSTTSAAGGAVVAYATSSWANLNIASGDQQVTLSWTDNLNPTGATKMTYNIYCGTSAGVKKNGSNVLKISNLTGTSFVHTGLVNGKSYYYAITAVTPDGTEGALSREASATPQAALPAAPTGISIKSGTGQITLGTGFTPISGVIYNVYWSTTSGVTKANGNKMPNVSFPSWVHYTQGANDGQTTYYYVVTAQTSSGESIESKQLSATTVNTSAGAAFGSPNLVNAVAGNQMATIGWNAPSSPISPPAGASPSVSYNLYWWTGAEPNKAHKISNGTSTSFTHQSLTNGTSYNYLVSAVQTITVAGAVSTVETDSATISVIPEAKAPAIPSGLSAAAQNQQVELAWTQDSSGNPVTYNVYWSIDNTNWLKISNISSNSYTQTGLQSGVTYYYKVSSQSAAESNTSATVSAAL